MSATVLIVITLLVAVVVMIAISLFDKKMEKLKKRDPYKHFRIMFPFQCVVFSSFSIFMIYYSGSFILSKQQVHQGELLIKYCNKGKYYFECSLTLQNKQNFKHRSTSNNEELFASINIGETLVITSKNNWILNIESNSGALLNYEFELRKFNDERSLQIFFLFLGFAFLFMQPIGYAKWKKKLRTKVDLRH